MTARRFLPRLAQQIAAGCTLFASLFLTCCAPPRFGRVTVGAKNFTEQVVLGELLAQEIEATGGKPVNRRFYLAGSYLCLRLGVGYEFQSRPDGLAGLQDAYGLRFGSHPRVMDLGLLYRALAAGQVDVVAGNSTDGPVGALGFRILTDNLHYFPPYEAVPLIREDTVHEHPEVQAAADRLAGKVSAEEMRTMNDAVDGQHRDVAEVVRAFRQQKGI